MSIPLTIDECSAGVWPSLEFEDFVNLCLHYGPTIRTEVGNKLSLVDGSKLLLALSGNESSFGHNCKPRHETGYCTGFYSHNATIVGLTKLFGHGAHCSYGPWQIMFCNAANDATPDKFRDAEYGAIQTVRFMNQILRANNPPRSLHEWGEVWNGGHVGARGPGVLNYCEELQKNWDAVEKSLAGIREGN
ncbi:MAG TPA: hypothetical protein VFN53_06380 [Acidobacteriaceae bacterium]|nr:hypothetical protein [Acidobacteriaceae bacterium]